MKKAGLLFLAGVVLFLASCKNTDEDAPLIGDVRINGALAGDHIHIEAGEPVEISIRVTDNESLGQLKIDIHANDDGHSHEDHEHSGGGIEGEWEVLQVVNLEGTDQTVTRSFTVPQTVRGPWHLLINVIDEAGNESTQRFIELDIDNEIIPLIDVDAINGVEPVGEVEIAPGSAIAFTGEVTDNAGLVEVHVEVKLENGTVIYEMEYDVAGALSFDLATANFTLPDNQGQVHGELHIKAKNVNDFTSEAHFEMHFE
jgi:hypothetical protein